MKIEMSLGIRYDLGEKKETKGKVRRAVAFG